jgi:hypothetical protein
MTKTRTRCSRTPCQTSQAPPISATAARVNRRIERSTVIASPYPGGVEWPGQRGDHTKRAVGYDEQNLTGTSLCTKGPVRS